MVAAQRTQYLQQFKHFPKLDGLVLTGSILSVKNWSGKVFFVVEVLGSGSSEALAHHGVTLFDVVSIG